jgi:hypothetical protein
MNTTTLNMTTLDGGVIIKKGEGGGATINNQDKVVDITENGTTEVVADGGYTGLGKVTINTEVSGGESGGSVKYYKGTLGVWGDLLSCCPVFMPIKSPVGDIWGLYTPVFTAAGGKQGLLADGKTTIIKSYSGTADFRDNPMLSQAGLRSFEEYVEFLRTQGAAMGINEEYTEITEDEFYTLFEQIKNTDSAE